MTDLNLVKRYDKNLSLSTGMANLEEIETTIKVAKKWSKKHYSIVLCE